ncbi:MAG: hypothetical protein H7246_04420 [Phycisphaerae bacterium]|nr:hypothetical protein [Saprospiraceae bacterium]
MNVLNFEDYKTQIQDAIQKKISRGSIVPSDPDGYILIDGFFNLPFYKEVGSNIILGGPSIPAVSVVGKSTGVIHTFALKVLLPNIQL